MRTELDVTIRRPNPSRERLLHTMGVMSNAVNRDERSRCRNSGPGRSRAAWWRIHIRARSTPPRIPTAASRSASRCCHTPPRCGSPHPRRDRLRAGRRSKTECAGGTSGPRRALVAETTFGLSTRCDFANVASRLISRCRSAVPNDTRWEQPGQDDTNMPRCVAEMHDLRVVRHHAHDANSRCRHHFRHHTQKARCLRTGPDLHSRWWRGQDLNLRPSGYEGPVYSSAIRLTRQSTPSS